MKRTDAHRPSAINPDEYTFVAFGHMRQDPISIALNPGEVIYQRRLLEEHMARTGGQFSAHEHGGSCHVCGAHAIYTIIWHHAPTNTYIKTGEDCARNMDMGFDANGFSAWRSAICDARQVYAGKRKAEVFLADEGLTPCWDIFNTPYPVWPAALPYEETTIRDIVSKLVKYGSISGKQCEFLHGLVQRIANRAAIAAKREAEKAMAADCPSGRMVIEGVVLSTKTQDSMYGTQFKMLVKHASGFKVWGTIPSGGNLDMKGCTVRFMATVEPSKDDRTFGFYSRPTKFSVVDDPAGNEPVDMSAVSTGPVAVA